MVVLKLEPGVKRLLFIKDLLLFLFPERGNLVIMNRGVAIWECEVNVNLFQKKAVLQCWVLEGSAELEFDKPKSYMTQS